MHKPTALRPIATRLSLDEIRARYPDRWVVLANVHEVIDRVYGYHRSVADVIGVFEQRPKAPPAKSECYWTGELPDCPAYWRIRMGLYGEGYKV